MSTNMPPLDGFLTYRIHLLAQLLGREAARIAASHGLGLPEYRVLWHLVTEGPCAAAEIAVRHAMDKAQVSRALAGLVAQGLATQRADPTDGRRLVAAATPAGRARHAALCPEAQARQARLGALLDPSTRRALDEALDILTRAARAAA
jgi:DNA-binding MarR family transcriptional regulator